MYSTIIVGSDGSSTAQVAVTKAGELAALCGATVHLVHGCGASAIGGDGMLAVPIVMTSETLSDLESQLDTQAESLRSAGVNVEVHAMTASGPEAVLTAAEELGADLVVVGNQGMTGKRRFILGSVPNAVSHHSPCSVLIVHTT
jgi:nucleotide-binding universal stress UspA family protein